jgi:integrase/recombinase XerD
VIEEYSETDIKAMVAACLENSAWSAKSGKIARNRRPTGKRDQAIVVVLVETGIRASELCDLEMRDYDQKKGQLHIRHGKGDKSRFVYLADSAQRYLWRYLAARKDVRPNDPLFATSTNRRISRDNLLNLIVSVAGRAGVASANVHKFRHTFAINFLRNGGNVLELKKLMGHEKIETLLIYVELAQADLARAMRTASPADHWRL